jgi:CheY-like chemotaxis protein
MKKTIFVVDDEADIQTVLHELLETSEYEVVSATNGQEALEKIEGGLKPDIMLLDLMMPHMSGYNLLSELQKRDLHTSFSIIVMSADSFTQAQIERMGIKGFVSKPFDINQVQELIDSL